jgi:hypothetical protein
MKNFLFDAFDMMHITNASSSCWIPYWKAELSISENLKRGSELVSDFSAIIDRTKCTPNVPRSHIIQVLGNTYSAKFLAPIEYEQARNLAIKYSAELFVLKISPHEYKCFATYTEKVLIEWDFWDKFVIGYNNEQRKYDALMATESQVKKLDTIISTLQETLNKAIKKKEPIKTIKQLEKTIEGYKRKRIKLYQTLPVSEDEIIKKIYKLR